ncbi:MAG: M15 family metallopeptidase [Clostridia bacterium]|nr:M15 family metallopeptidase [Clostridia bacterium]
MAAPKRKASRNARERRKKQVAGGLILAVVLAITLGMILYLNQPVRLELTGENRFHVGDKVMLSDVVKGVLNGSLATGDIQLDSSKEGTQDLTVTVKNRMGREMDETVQITFWQEDFNPVITAPDTLSYFIIEGQSEKKAAFDPLKDVSATDEKGKSYPVTVRGKYDLTKEGEYKITYVAASGDGQTVTKDAVLTVTVVRSPFDEKGEMMDGTYKTAKGFDLIIKGGIAYVDGYMIVNKSYTVPNGFSSTGDGTRSLTPETEAAWKKMHDAAPAEIRGNLTIRSGVRNIADQTVIFNNYVRENGLEEALTFSARPRHSEHHTGLAMDITTSSTELASQQPAKAVMDWLNENAWQYGFILRYPEGKADETGYIFEPWHYRYVGEELAKTLYNNGDWITMEDYFGVDSAYKN